MVIKVVAEYGRNFDPKLKKKALDIIKSSLGDKLFKGSSVDKLLDAPLRDLTIKNGTQACVILHPRIYDDFKVGGVEYSDAFVSKEYNCFNADSWLEDKW